MIALIHSDNFIDNDERNQLVMCFSLDDEIDPPQYNRISNLYDVCKNTVDYIETKLNIIKIITDHAKKNNQYGLNEN